MNMTMKNRRPYCVRLLLLMMTVSSSSLAFVMMNNGNAAARLVSSSRSRSPSPSSFLLLHMFTGIVEEMGTVISLDKRSDMILWDGTTGEGTELTVQGDIVLEGAYIGCSICVSGVCLTATQLDPNSKTFKVGLAPETLRKTYFETLRAGDAVNLERASEIGGRNSGHFVQGHVDGTGTIINKVPDKDSLAITVRVDNPDLIKYIVPKGFVAVDGTSLTVVDVNIEEGTFSFMLIEYTQKKIIIPSKNIGDKVNLEVDVLGKYSESALSALIPRIEALESKIVSLERSLMSGGGRGGGGGGQQAPPPVDPVSQARSTMLSQHPGSMRSAQQDKSMMRPKPLTVESLSYSETKPSANPHGIKPSDHQRFNTNNVNSYTPTPKPDAGRMYSPTSIPPKQQQNQQQQQSPRVRLDPKPPITTRRPGDFSSSPTGSGVPDIPHQESQPDPLL